MRGLFTARVRRRLRLALLLSTLVLSWTLFLGPVRADGPCVAGPNGSCSLPCDIGGSPTIAEGYAGGSVGATISGCGTGTSACNTTCRIHGIDTSGVWTAQGGTRGMTMRTVRQFTGTPK